MFKVKPKRQQNNAWSHSGVFVVNFEHISHLILVFLLLNLNMLCQLGWAKKYKFEEIQYLNVLK